MSPSKSRMGGMELFFILFAIGDAMKVAPSVSLRNRVEAVDALGEVLSSGSSFSTPGHLDFSDLPQGSADIEDSDDDGQRPLVDSFIQEGSETNEKEGHEVEDALDAHLLMDLTELAARSTQIAHLATREAKLLRAKKARKSKPQSLLQQSADEEGEEEDGNANTAAAMAELSSLVHRAKNLAKEVKHDRRNLRVGARRGVRRARPGAEEEDLDDDIDALDIANSKTNRALDFLQQGIDSTIDSDKLPLTEDTDDDASSEEQIPSFMQHTLEGVTSRDDVDDYAAGVVPAEEDDSDEKDESEEVDSGGRDPSFLQLDEEGNDQTASEEREVDADSQDSVTESEDESEEVDSGGRDPSFLQLDEEGNDETASEEREVDADSQDSVTESEDEGEEVDSGGRDPSFLQLDEEENDETASEEREVDADSQDSATESEDDGDKVDSGELPPSFLQQSDERSEEAASVNDEVDDSSQAMVLDRILYDKLEAAIETARHMAGLDDVLNGSTPRETLSESNETTALKSAANAIEALDAAGMVDKPGAVPALRGSSKGAVESTSARPIRASMGTTSENATAEGEQRTGEISAKLKEPLPPANDTEEAKITISTSSSKASMSFSPGETVAKTRTGLSHLANEQVALEADQQQDPNSEGLVGRFWTALAGFWR